MEAVEKKIDLSKLGVESSHSLKLIQGKAEAQRRILEREVAKLRKQFNQ